MKTSALRSRSGAMLILATVSSCRSPLVEPQTVEVRSVEPAEQEPEICIAYDEAESDHYSVSATALETASLLSQVSDLAAGISTRRDALQALCSLFGDGEPPKSDDALAQCATGHAAFRATTDGLDGTWHFLGFAGERFVTMYEPPNRSLVYPPTTWSIRQEGPLAVHTIQQPAFVCPSDEAALCVAWSPREEVVEGAGRYFCPDAKALPCERQGVSGEVYVVDPATTKSIRLGPIERGEMPAVVIDGAGTGFVATTSACKQPMSL